MAIQDDTATMQPGAEALRNVHEIMGPRMMRKSPVLEEAWRYWSSVRRGAALPKRADLDPASMRLILGHSLILDRVRPGTVRVRLGGRVANDLMGMETRGLPIRAFFDLLQRSRAIELVERVFTDVATLEMDLISEGADGPLAARMVILPLADATGAPTKALAVLVPDRIATDGPRRFSILRHHLGALAATGAPPARAQATAESPVRQPVRTTPPVYNPMPDAAPVYAAAEAPARFVETPVPWLRVVK